MSNNRLFTSESVTIGHPDKMADQISDAVLDEVLRQDRTGRVACETFLKGSLAVVGGEITAACDLNIPAIVQRTAREIGYTDKRYGFDVDGANIVVSMNQQSEDIARGVVDEEEEETLGAGDMGIMFGYATKETDVLMPLPIMLARGLTDRLTAVRQQGVVPFLRPDGKAQVTVEYGEDQRPKQVQTIVLAAQHNPDVDQEEMKQQLTRHVVEETIDPSYLSEETTIHVNPTGVFEQGGPDVDTGMTGRKTIVDTYGGMGTHGGGCFSGKDPTKVDRSAAFMARYAAKNVVAADLAWRCEVQLSYAIGRPDPVSVSVDTFGTETVEPDLIEEALHELFDFTPGSMIETFQLRRPIYLDVTRKGHMGVEEEPFRWENTDKVDTLQEFVDSVT